MTPRVVYDTMVFLQAAARPLRVHRSIQAMRNREILLCVSDQLLAEVQDVLSRPELRAKFPALTGDAVEAFLIDVVEHAVLYVGVPRVFSWSEHPDDDHVFNLCIASGAAVLVTWERRIKGLLESPSPSGQELKRLAPQLRVVTPAEFDPATL